MPGLCRTLTPSEPRTRNGRSTIALLVSTALFLFSQPVEAIQTSTYVFDPNHSTVVKTGGFAGVHETYSIAGQFCSSVDFDAGCALFEKVDANLIDQEGSVYAWDLDTIFNVTALPGAVVDDTTIRFEGKTADGTDSDVLLTLTFGDDSAHLTGTVTPPPNTADLFFYQCDAVASRKYAGGTGEPSGPYQIATSADLILLGDSPEDYNKHFILTADIDLNPSLPGRRVFDRAVIAPDTDYTRKDFQGAVFTGVFDGNGHKILRLKITGGDFLGLFGLFGNGAKVFNLGLQAIDIRGLGGYVGGLVGSNWGNILASYSSGTISGDRLVGGLVGRNWNGHIAASYSSGSVSGTGHYIGGLVGTNLYGSITTSYSSTSVSGTGYSVGGLVGINNGSIAASYCSGSVSGTGRSVGGLVGRNYSRVATCYSTSTVNGDSGVGGLIGSNGTNGKVNLSYSTGLVRGKQSVGGLVGSNDGDVTTSVWDTQTSGQSTSAGGRGLTTAKMMDPEALGLQGWAGDPNWILDSGRDYPRLTWEGTSGQTIPGPVIDWLNGSGTTVDPFQIENADQLLTLNEYSFFWDKHFVLKADIDLDPNLPNRSVFGQALIPTFEGSFDGKEHVILNLHIKGENSLGLLGKSTKSSTVRNLGLENVSVHGTRSNIGGLAGSNEGQVLYCYSTGQVMGIESVGGLVGRNVGVITSSFYTGTVNGKYSVGGLVGSNHSGVTICCHSTGTVSGLSNIGGLAGFSSDWSYVTDCYSTSTVSGDYCVGGLLGENTGDVFDCSCTGAVTGDSDIGGLVGNNLGNVTSCHSMGAAHGSKHVGGLVGFNWRRVRGCDSSGDVGGDNYIGGLVGYNRGDVTYCHSAGSVDGGSSVGGLVGLNNNWADVVCCYSAGTITGSNKIGGLVGANGGTTDNCYATGPATGNRDIGGLVGHNDTGTITNCYSVGLITGTVAAGGLAGSNEDGQITNSFWDTQMSGQTTSAGGIGKNTTQMYTAGTFLGAGWDFVDEIENGTEDIWWILEEQDYPEFVWNSWAVSPHPADGATEVQQPLILTWIVGKVPLHHDVYFGEDEGAVANATSGSPEIFRGQQAAETILYDPGPLELSKTYYWRIDEVNEANPSSPWRGKVWSFTTADHILVLVVEDFERYIDDDAAGVAVWQVWIDGYHNGTGSQVSYLLPPYCEQTIVHGGCQSMPFFYDNDGMVYEGFAWEKPALFYSEAMRAFDLPWDWTISDADTLTLFFRGEAGNDPDSLYVGIEDKAGRIAVMTHPDDDAVLTTEWQIWHVPLMDMRAAGVDLTSVLKMYIGVGDRDNPQPGGAGLIYIDDIQVINQMP